MSKICANCGGIQGPFAPIQIFHNDTIWTCKNTKNAQDRITDCVKRREKTDFDKYKEQLHAYS